MLESQFKTLIQQLIKSDDRYHKDAYEFLRDALDVAQSVTNDMDDAYANHVNATQLLEGIRIHALEVFGPMAVFVLNEWGIHTSKDFGNMVFNLIDIGLFSKRESDCIEDFEGGFSFYEAFTKPYTPSIKRGKKTPMQKQQKT